MGFHGKACFIAASPMHYACFKQIHRFIPEVRLIADNRETARYFRKNGIDFSRFPGFPDCIIMADYLHMKKRSKTRYPSSVRLIQINHGLGLAKSHYFTEAVARPPFDLYLVSGEAAKERLERMGLKRPIAAVGFAKLDPLFDGSLKKDDICQRLGIDPTKPVILYAPTHGDLSSFDKVAPYLPELAQSYNLLVKLHQHTYRERFSRSQSAILKNIYLIEDCDCTEYLFIADLLISDVSSIVFEYALLDRPMLLIQPPKEKWHPRVTNPKWWDVGYALKEDDRLPEVVRELMAKGDQRSEFRRRLIASTGIPCDGRAAERSAEAIKEIFRRDTV